MNLLLLMPDDFVAPNRARLTGRRVDHVREIHRAIPGQTLRVGVLNGNLGTGLVTHLDAHHLDVEVHLEGPPPPKLPWTLLLALPRPKVLNRVLASATSLGVARIVLMNAWRVEKAYWKSPRMSAENLRQQCILGLEQARDTVLPDLRTARFFRSFLEQDLPDLARNSRCLLAHPGSSTPCPRSLPGPLTLAIGPEGGWIPEEVESFRKAGFEPVDMGPRILRTETALATLTGRLMPA